MSGESNGAPKKAAEKPKDDWMNALEELQGLDAKRRERRKLEHQQQQANKAKVSEDSPPAPEDLEEESAVRITAQPAQEAPKSVENPEEEKMSEGSESVSAEERPDKDSTGVTRTNKYLELCKQKSMEVKQDDLAVMDEFSDVIGCVSEAANLLTKFTEDFPDVIPEKKQKIWDDNLRETASIMFREFHQLRHGKQKKSYDKKYICQDCKSVFMVPLPGGLCDECQSKRIPRSSKY